MLAALMLAAVFAPAQDPVATIREKLKDPSQPFTLVVRFKTKPGQGDDFVKAFAAAVKGTRQEPGNLRYELNRDPAKPDEFLLYERWKDLPALEEHFKQPYLTKTLQAVTPLLAEPVSLTVMLPAEMS
jgi:autoinducer 2-degrading protein